MTKEEVIESFKCSNEQAKLRLEVEKMRMDSGEIKELEFYIERDEMAIKALDQEPKTGHWKRNETIRLTYCSKCGFGQHIDEFRTYNFCPNCGAKMVDPQESEVQDADND